MNSDAYHAFMMDHAGGTLSSDMAIAAELHILLSDRGHETADIWNAARTVLGVADGCPEDYEHAFLPEALELARSEFSTIPWKRGLSGVHYAKRGKGRGKLMRLDPGQAAPEHSHSALEATVVLKGQFEDGHGALRPWRSGSWGVLVCGTAQRRMAMRCASASSLKNRCHSGD